jgi:hypothetical protein
MRGAYKMVLDERELAFGEAAEMREQPVADKPAEDGVAEELEAFIIGRRAIGCQRVVDGCVRGFIGSRTVSQGAGEQ